MKILLIEKNRQVGCELQRSLICLAKGRAELIVVINATTQSTVEYAKHVISVGSIKIESVLTSCLNNIISKRY